MSATGGAIDVGAEGASAVLVDLIDGELETSSKGEGRHKTYLAKSHGDNATIRACRQTRRCTLSRSSSNTSLRRTVGLGSATTQETLHASGTTLAIRTPVAAAAEESTEQLASLARWLLDVVLNTYTARCSLVGRRSGTFAHEGADHDACDDGAVALSAAQGTGFSAGDFPVADDGGVGLGTAPAIEGLVGMGDESGRG